MNSEHPQIKLFGKDTVLILDGPGPMSCEQIRPVTQQTLYCAHTGFSMNPTLYHSDLLEVSSYDMHLPKAGDVILCVPPGGSQAVVHRVIEATRQGFRTRGDNNDRDDAWLVGPDDILGRVAAVYRGERRRKIAGGPRGRVVAKIACVRSAADRVISPLLRPFYHALAAMGIVQRFLPARLRPRVVSFAGATGPQWRLIFRRQVVGRYDTAASRWVIRRPYHLLVEEKAPGPGSKTDALDISA